MEAFESFSFYGLGSLIMLYMMKKLGFLEVSSIAIFALFMVLAEFLSLVGGFIADRLFGIVHCLKMGGYLMLVGYLLVPFLPGNWFLLGLGFIVIGSGLFSSNTTTLLGLFYGRSTNTSRDAGFMLYYASLNLGAFFSLILCGLVVEKYDWKYGLILAALGIVPIVWLLHKYENLLSEKDITPSSSLKIRKLMNAFLLLSPFLIGIGFYHYTMLAPLMPFVFAGAVLYLLREYFKCSTQERIKILNIFILVILLTLFFGVAEQIRTSLVFFADRHVETNILGWSVPLSSLIAINPIIIVLISPILSLRSTYTSYEVGLKKISRGFALLFLAFSYLLLLTYCSVTIKLIHLLIVFSGVAFSELLVGPVVYSLCSTLSPKHLKGSMMGVITIGYAAANHLAGYLAHLMAVKENMHLEASIEIYRDGLKLILVIVLGGAIFSALIGRKKTLTVSALEESN